MIYAAVVALAVWLLALTLLQFAAIRQLAVLKVAAAGGGIMPTFDPTLDGPQIGSPVPEQALAALERGVGHLVGDATVVFMSASCGPCREMASAIAADGIAESDTIFLVAGRPSIASALIEELAVTGRPIIPDPDAHEIVQAMNIHGTPFVFQIDGGSVSAKKFVASVDDIRRSVRRTGMRAVLRA